MQPANMQHEHRPVAGDGRAILIIGLGFTGQRLAKKLMKDHNLSVIGTVRSESKAKQLETDNPGLRCLVFDGSSASNPGPGLSDLVAALDNGDISHVLQCAPPNAGDIDGDAFLKNQDACKALKNAVDNRCIVWMGYLSTVAVYGNHDGGWVDEECPLNPVSRRGKLRVKAESQWRDLQGPLHIFRLPGIYGPFRGPLNRIRQGTARRIRKANQYFSRIHVEDIAGVLIASMLSPEVTNANVVEILAAHPLSAGVYNVVDDMPAPSYEVTAHAAYSAGRYPPPLQDWDQVKDELSPMARSFYGESKRVKNTKITTELKYELVYPTYVEGHAGQLREEMSGLPYLERLRSQILPVRTIGIVIGYFLQQPAVQASLSLINAMGSKVSSLFIHGTDNSSKRTEDYILLTDNGSLKPASTLALRDVARRLSKALGKDVNPVSFRFSDRIPQDLLGNMPAHSLKPWLESNKDTLRSIIILPYFLGPSSAIDQGIKGVLKEVLGDDNGGSGKPANGTGDPKVPPHRWAVAEPMAIDEWGVDAVARILLDNAAESLRGLQADGLDHEKGDIVRLVACDHGSPKKEVAAVRDRIAARMQALLDPSSSDVAHANAVKDINSDNESSIAELRKFVTLPVSPCSMERREGDLYKFTDPLLENLVDALDLHKDAGERRDLYVVIAMMFLSPGRHAGPGGDVAQIIQELEKKHATARISTVVTGLMGAHPATTQILTKRFKTLSL